MFLRHWSGLPKDSEFPCDLKGLGYFVNKDDEIRSIQDPNYYFKYFIDRNERINDRQRFGMNTAVEDIVHERLEAEGLMQVLLPLGTPTTKPHTRIFVSVDIETKSRVIVVFGEACQMVGCLALRIVNHQGGINKGSMIPVVKDIKKQRCSKDDKSSPGIILANTGELWWWPEGNRALDPPRKNAVPMKSAVHLRRYHDDKLNNIPENENRIRHAEYILGTVLPKIAKANAKIDLLCIGDGGDSVINVLNDDKNWERYGKQLHAMVLLGGCFHSENLAAAGFIEFMKTRTRAYITDEAPLNTPIANCDGNPKHPGFTNFGCPVYSSSEEYYVEMILPKIHGVVLGWFQHVADTENYCNDPDLPVVNPVVMDSELDYVEARAKAWEAVPNEQRPSLSVDLQEELEKERKLLRAWKEFQETGKINNGLDQIEEEDDD